jgi:hypothetical protein
MQAKRNSHIRTLFQVMKPGHVVTSEYLLSLGIPKGQQAYYAKSGWLEPVGSGAFKKPGDTISWEGAIQALQQQTEIPVHLGAQTAAEFHGNVHYLRMWAKFRVDLLTPVIPNCHNGCLNVTAILRSGIFASNFCLKSSRSKMKCGGVSP